MSMIGICNFDKPLEVRVVAPKMNAANHSVDLDFPGNVNINLYLSSEAWKKIFLAVAPLLVEDEVRRLRSLLAESSVD